MITAETKENKIAMRNVIFILILRTHLVPGTTFIDLCSSPLGFSPFPWCIMGAQLPDPERWGEYRRDAGSTA